ncbi:LysR family transcriptional regulator, partial [Paracoccus sp. PXZ]
MDLRHLRYVVATARNGSFSAAALELEVQQPIVSRRIRELEEELGVAFFDRSTAGAKPGSRLIEFHSQNKTVAA